MLNPKQLETEEMNRIMALCKRASAAEGGIGDMPGLMEEVSVDYLRTMNKIVLEAQTKEVKNELFGIRSDLPSACVFRTQSIVVGWKTLFFVHNGCKNLQFGPAVIGGSNQFQSCPCRQRPYLPSNVAARVYRQLSLTGPYDALVVPERFMQQAHQPQGWKQAGSEILRSLRVPRGVYREEKPPPAKASVDLSADVNSSATLNRPKLACMRGNQPYRTTFEAASVSLNVPVVAEK